MAIDAKRTVPGYGLVCPTEQDLLQGLTKFMDQSAAEQTWDAACRQRGVRRPIAQQRHDELLSARRHADGPATILDDHARLQEIVDLNLLSDDVDVILNQLAAEAAAHFDLPLGFVSVVLDETQHLAAQHGLDNYIGASRGTPVE